MTISIDYSDDATPQYVINVPRSYGTIVQTTPTEIRSVNIDQFRTDLNDLMDDSEGMAYPTNHDHFAPVTVSGTTLARVVLIRDPYAVKFEDAQYNVNIVGGNSNIADKTIKNQVGINTANSAGLQDPFSLQAASYANEVTIDEVNGEVGTTFPKGTRGAPVKNLADAVFIANQRGLVTIRVVGHLTIDSGDYSQGFIFKGDSQETSSVTIAPAANVLTCEFNNLAVSGVLDGVTVLRDCSIGAVSGYNGLMVHCGVTGPVTTTDDTKVAEFLDCFSEVPGGGPGAFPYIQFDGSGGSDLVIRGWKGGLGLRDQTRNDFVASLDVESGRVTVDDTVTHGDITVRGSAEIFDNSIGSTEVSDKTLEALTAGYVWDETLINHTDPGSFGEQVQSDQSGPDPSDVADAVLESLLPDGVSLEDTLLRVRRHLTNKLITDPVSGLASLYDDAGSIIDEVSALYEDSDATQAYQGQGAERREGFEAPES